MNTWLLEVYNLYEEPIENIGWIMPSSESFAVFVNAICNGNRMIKQLGSNIGSFAQKLKIFNGACQRGQ